MIQMKKMETFLILFMLCFPCWGCAQRIFDWENPNVVGHNKEDYHSTLMLPSRKSECKEIMLLRHVEVHVVSRSSKPSIEFL